MDFTREPIIETIITPKEGCKLVVRNSKGVGQEEYFVDAVEVVTFGQAIFFRSLERPKAFIVPASDYEVLEVREARIVLKNVGLDRSIKIAGGREAAMRAPKEQPEEKMEAVEAVETAAEAQARAEGRGGDRKKDRRRQSRRRKGRDGMAIQEGDQESPKLGGEERIDISLPERGLEGAEISETVSMTGSLMSHLLAPPPLISETIARYKEKFKEAFYAKEEEESSLSLDEPDKAPLMKASEPPPLEQPAFGSFEISEEDEEEIYRQRRRRFFPGDEAEEGSEGLSEDDSRDLKGSKEVVTPDQQEE